MVDNGVGTNNIFRQVEHIQISDIHHQAYGYFGLMGIVNFVSVLPNPLVLSAILNLFTSAQEVKTFYDRVCSDILAKSIEG